LRLIIPHQQLLLCRNPPLHFCEMTPRPRASTIDSFRQPKPLPIKVKKEEGVVIKTEPGILPNFPRSSSCSPGDLIRGDRKKMSDISKRVRSLFRNTPFRRPTTPLRGRSVSRMVSASPAPSSIATNTTSGLRLDVRPPFYHNQRSLNITPPTIIIDDEDEEDDDNVSSASRASTVVCHGKSQ
jgi:hypothetical protein